MNPAKIKWGDRKLTDEQLTRLSRHTHMPVEQLRQLEPKHPEPAPEDDDDTDTG